MCYVKSYRVQYNVCIKAGMDFQLINPYEEGCKWEQTLEY